MGWGSSSPVPTASATRRGWSRREQKAKEAELQVAALCENMEALAARAARSQHQETAIEVLTDTLVQKDALLEAQGDALRSAETALEERGASVSAFLQQVDAAWAELDVGAP